MTKGEPWIRTMSSTIFVWSSVAASDRGVSHRWPDLATGASSECSLLGYSMGTGCYRSADNVPNVELNEPTEVNQTAFTWIFCWSSRWMSGDWQVLEK